VILMSRDAAGQFVALRVITFVVDLRFACLPLIVFVVEEAISVPQVKRVVF